MRAFLRRFFRSPAGSETLTRTTSTRTTRLAEETRLYQAALEEARANPEDGELAEVVEQQRRSMELAWLHAVTGE